MSSRRLAWLAVLALVAPAAAGCLTLTPESAADAGLLEAPVPVPFEALDATLDVLTLTLPDGVPLNMAVLRPVTEEPVPVILDAGPYFGNLAPPTHAFVGFHQRLAEVFVPEGYAIVKASVRGTGTSGGCFDLGGEQEQQDLHDLVEFLGDQEWSNGAVGMIGASYDGTTPWMAAIQAPPALKTIVPVAGITDMYRYMFYEGAAYGHGPIFNTYYNLYVDYGAGSIHEDIIMDQAQAKATRTCADFPVQAVKGLETGVTGDHDAFWDERNYEDHLDAVQASVFLVHGLQDWNVKPDHGLRVFNELNVEKRAWLGQWAHDYPDMNRFNEEWSRDDWNATLLAWFDHYLKGVDNGVLAHLPTVEVQDHLGNWRAEDAWPPARVTDLPLHLHADGGLDREASADAGAFTFHANALGPDLLGRPTDARFVTAPLTEALHVSGEPRVTVHVSVDRPAANLVAALFDVHPDGTWQEVDRGFLDLRHRDGRDAGELAPINEVMEVTVTMYPQDLVFQEGHQVGLAIVGEHPMILPGKGGPAGYEVHVGGERGSVLHLPVLPETAGGFSG